MACMDQVDEAANLTFTVRPTGVVLRTAGDLVLELRQDFSQGFARVCSSCCEALLSAGQTVCECGERAPAPSLVESAPLPDWIGAPMLPEHFTDWLMMVLEGAVEPLAAVLMAEELTQRIEAAQVACEAFLVQHNVIDFSDLPRGTYEELAALMAAAADAVEA